MSQSTKVAHEQGALGAEQFSGTGALGALSLSHCCHIIVTTGAATGTLADGTQAGQLKHIVLKTDGGDYVLTPANYANGTTLTFDDAGDSATLLWDGAAWTHIGTPTATSA